MPSVVVDDADEEGSRQIAAEAPVTFLDPRSPGTWSLDRARLPALSLMIRCLYLRGQAVLGALTSSLSMAEQNAAAVPCQGHEGLVVVHALGAFRS